MRTKGLEPPRRETPDPKSGAATITPRAQNLMQSYELFSKPPNSLRGICVLRHKNIANQSMASPFVGDGSTEAVEGYVAVPRIPIVGCEKFVVQADVKRLFRILGVGWDAYAYGRMEVKILLVGKVAVADGYIVVA